MKDKKKCIKCNKVKLITEFSKGRNQCKTCRKAYNKAKRRKDYIANTTDYYILYLIVNYNGLGDGYVGITKNLRNRKRIHKNGNKRYTSKDVSTVRVLHKIYGKEEALRMERMYHDLDFHGANENDNRTSDYIGVCWAKSKGKWQSAIKISGKLYHLGYFTEEIEASEVYQKALVLKNKGVNVTSGKELRELIN